MDKFACRLIVVGEGGGVFDFMFSEASGIQPKLPDVPLRNKVFLTIETLQDLVYPDLTELRAQNGSDEKVGLAALLYLIKNKGVDDILPQLKPRMTLAKALGEGEIEFDGENPDIDFIKWRKIFDKLLVKVALPIMVKSIWVGNKDKAEV